jgi:acetyl-CoA acetyltransferase
VSTTAVGILGYGETKHVKHTDRTLFSFFAEAALQAVSSAGLKKDQIDGLAVSSFFLAPDNAVTLSEQFGLSISWAWQFSAGSAGPVAGVMDAVRAVQAGQAEYVLCLAGDLYSVAAHYKLMRNFNHSLSNYAAPHGFGGPNGLFGIIQRKYMEKYGLKAEQLGKIAVAQRDNALLNENAVFRTPLTLDDYLNSRMIADPIRLYDCVLPVAGADAVIVGPLTGTGRGVKILSGYEQHNYPPGEVCPLSGGWEVFRDRLYEDAGYGPEQMDFIENYDDYPIMSAIQLEDLGFCAKGEVGDYIDAHSFTWDGDVPMNTGGGQLSVGQAGAGGGLMSVVEATRQIRGEAGARQIATAERAVVAGYGMVGYGHGLSASAIVVEGENAK